MSKDKSNKQQERASQGNSQSRGKTVGNTKQRFNDSVGIESISESTITAHFSPPKKPIDNGGSTGSR